MERFIFDLCGAWQLGQRDVFPANTDQAMAGSWLEASVPNSVYCNLAEADQFELADVENNPERYGWVADAHWVYRKNFEISADLLEKERIELIFEGLDTVARIWLNGTLLGQAENMYIEHRFDAKALLKPAGNELVVAFEPVREYATRKRNEHPIDGIDTLRSYVRKAQYTYGWDWCPPLEGCGIWRAVRLEGVTLARIENVYAHTLEIGDDWADVQIEIELDTVVDGDYSCTYALSADGGSGTLEFPVGQTKATTVVRVENPQLWWPVGYGEAHLYDLDVVLVAGTKKNIDRKSARFGIRTVELDTSPDEHGHKYQFVINSQPIYIKGANWVPATMFPGSVPAAHYRALIDSALDVNMNILRVWGGGYYEDRAFYDYCDEKGVMVWQEFMFACAYYPDEEWYHDMVRTESEFVIKQLRNHPCKVVWCGNNENDWLHWEFWHKQTPVFHGERIYHEVLPAQMARFEPTGTYVPSSPIATRKGVDINPNEPDSGDAHDWAVWNFQQPLSAYLVPPEKVNRLATEFGMHGMVDMESLKKFCPPEDRRIGSKSLDKHNYQSDNDRVYRYIGELFGMPRNLEEFSYLSQVVQARGLGAYCEYLRAHNYRNHGIMIWQYNDAAPCISWSMLDYYNQPKALMHYARRFFADVLVTAVPNPPRNFDMNFLGQPRDPLSIRVIVAVNDSAKPIAGQLACSLLDLNGGILERMVHEVAIPPHGRFALDELPETFQRPEAAEACILTMELLSDGKVVAENTFLYAPDKHIEWPVPKIDRAWADQGGKQVLKLSCDIFVKDLQISAGPDVRLSDNYFDLLPNREYSVVLETSGAIIELDQIKLRSVQTFRD